MIFFCKTCARFWDASGFIAVVPAFARASAEEKQCWTCTKAELVKAGQGELL